MRIDLTLVILILTVGISVLILTQRGGGLGVFKGWVSTADNNGWSGIMKWVGWLGWGRPKAHSYTNLCLTHKSYGFPGSAGAYNYWRDRPAQWAVEYSEERVRGDIDTVRSSKDPISSLAGSQPAPAGGAAVSPRYYHNPVKYCKESPNDYPCPNHWISDGDPRNFFSDDMERTYGVPVPALKPWAESPAGAPASLVDGGSLNIIEPGREDHGLC